MTSFAGFTDPFRYVPHPLTGKAAELAMQRVSCLEEDLRTAFSQGKMMGVLVVEVPEGKVRSLIVPGPSKMLGLGPSRHDYCIPWECIRRIGPDIVLADVNPDDCRIGRPKARLKP